MSDMDFRLETIKSKALIRLRQTFLFCQRVVKDHMICDEPELRNHLGMN